VVVAALDDIHAEGKTIEIVARERREGDDVEGQLGTLFMDLPRDTV
jgi:hypothetical protein